MSVSVGVVLFLIFVGCCNSINQNRKKREPWGFEQGSTQSRSGSQNHGVTTTFVFYAVVFSYITLVVGVIHSKQKKKRLC
jgi:preprotein translocase subunit SecG